MRKHFGLHCSGLTVPIERKRALYAICAEYDVIIIEDDPYYYLQFGVRSAHAAFCETSKPVANAEATC
jgi:DNA-binding transcriptional MocR family regulator